MLVADEIRRIDYYYVTVPYIAGEAARISNALLKSGIALLAFSGFPRGVGRSRLHFIPEDSAAFKNAAKDLGLKLGKKKTGFLIRGKDQLGAVAGVLDRLAQANIAVTSVQAVSAGAGRFRALLWVKPLDVHNTANQLFASQFHPD
jgi:hypothetical protein